MLQTLPSVSVVVLNYNGKNYVKRCLTSLFKNNYPNFEVLFIDNNSPDKSANIAEELFRHEPRFRLIRNKTNLGFSMGNNIGFNSSKAKYVISLNNDTEVQENFIKILVEIAESDDKIGSVGCKIIQSDSTISYGPKYINYGFITSASKKQTYEKETCDLANCGCAVLFRKSLIQKIGGFDTYLWTDWEDHDLGYRINLSGYKCIYTPKTVVLHLGGGNYLGMTQERKTRILRNKLLCYYKNYETKNLLVRLPIITLKCLAAEGITSLKKRKVSSVTNSFADFLKLTQSLNKIRNEIQTERKLSDKAIFDQCRVPEKQSIWRSLRRI